MTADGPLSMGRTRVRGRCVCQRPDDAEAVRKPRTCAERRALDPELEAMPDRGAGRVTSPATFQCGRERRVEAPGNPGRQEMKPFVRQLILRGFRSIPAARIEFGNPTILVGRNASGKSNIVSAFSFLADAMSMPLSTVFDRAGGFASVRNRSSGGGRAAESRHARRFRGKNETGKKEARFLCVRNQGESGASFVSAERRMRTLRGEEAKLVRPKGEAL